MSQAKMNVFAYRFVDEIPDKLEEGVVYLSIRFRVAIHLCFCGCLNEVVTPLGPKNWSLTFDGETISLSPSVGSWSLRCASHYMITRNRVRWIYDEAEMPQVDIKEKNLKRPRTMPKPSKAKAALRKVLNSLTKR